MVMTNVKKIETTEQIYEAGIPPKETTTTAKEKAKSPSGGEG